MGSKGLMFGFLIVFVCLLLLLLFSNSIKYDSSLNGDIARKASYRNVDRLCNIMGLSYIRAITLFTSVSRIR